MGAVTRTVFATDRQSVVADWFVLNASEAHWLDNDAFGAYTRFERDGRFEQFGINLSVLQPGQPMCLYHGEEDQEDFLVLCGRGGAADRRRRASAQGVGLRPLPAVDGARDRRRRRRARRWCWPSVRDSTTGVVYPVSELAARYGASADIEHRRGAEGKAGESPYVGFPEDREGEFPGWLR